MHPHPWQPTASLKNLEHRAGLLWRLREFFHRRNFAEVQTPILSHDTVIDRHIDPVSFSGASVSLESEREQTLFLQTSPEFCMKRLLAAGMTAIYEITSVFRAAERGDYHNPEFTMVEWYRVGDDFEQGVQLLSDLICAALDVDQVDIFTYQEVFQSSVGRDPLSATRLELAQCAIACNLGVDLNWSEHRDDWLDLLFSLVVQPQLGTLRPVIVTNYPASQSALARVSSVDDRTAERYELFVAGVELANGYHELLDPHELEQRNQRVLIQRSLDRKPPLAAESYLLDAMRAGLPACSGCALGFDRLLMVAVGASRIDEVMAFPIERA